MSFPAVAVTQRRGPGLRIIPALETYPGLVEAVKTPAGKAVLVAFFAAALGIFQPSWVHVAVLLALTTYFPQRRRALVALGTGVVALLLPNLESLSLRKTAATLVVFALGAAMYAAARLPSGARWLPRPLAVLICGTTAYVAIIGWRPGAFAADSMAWQVADALSRYQWFIAYALLDRLSPTADSAATQVGGFAPFWGSTVTPFPKGAANLRRIEARDATSLAVTQLKGMKLLLWCLLLAVGYQLFRFAAYDKLGVPSLDAVLGRIAAGSGPGFLACWSAIICAFISYLFALTLLGHTIVACCRMAGFAALRNTYRPFESRTVAEFWNRYYYYFKELLVDVFYYPAFVRYFKKHPWLRRNFAVFAAVFFGDLYFHLFRDLSLVQSRGFLGALRMMDVYAVQCAMLTVAICISQAQSRKRRGAPGPLARGFAAVRVVLFYCFMFAFVDESFMFSLGVHLKFFAALLGVHLT